MPHWYLYTLILGTTTNTHKFPAVSKQWRECRFHLTSSHKYKPILLTGTPVVHDANDRLHKNLWTVCSIIIRGQAHTVTPRSFISNKSKPRLILRRGATNHLPSVLQYIKTEKLWRLFSSKRIKSNCSRQQTLQRKIKILKLVHGSFFARFYYDALIWHRADLEQWRKFAARVEVCQVATLFRCVVVVSMLLNLQKSYKKKKVIRQRKRPITSNHHQKQLNRATRKRNVLRTGAKRNV
jgi:hypothetical protein